MPTDWPIITWILLGLTFPIIYLAIHALGHVRVPGARPLAGLLFTSALYVGGFALELPPDLAAHQTWILALEYLGISFIPPFIALVFARCSGRGAWMTRRVLTAMFALSLALALTKATDPWHGLIYRSLEPTVEFGLNINRATPGPVYWVVLAYINGALAYGFAAALRTWRQAGPFHRRQLTSLMAAAAILWFTHLWYQSGLSPWGRLDLCPFGFLAATPLIYWAVFRNQLARIAPVARDRLVEMLPDGVVVIDGGGHVVDLNPAAAAMLGVEVERTLGRSVHDLLERWPEIRAITREPGRAIVETSGTPAWEAGWTPLATPHARHAGHLLVLRDIADRRQHELHLRTLLDARTRDWHEATTAALRASEEEQDRISREVHDTLCQELVGVSRSAEALALRDGSPPEMADGLRRLAEAAAASARRARHIAHTLARLEDTHSTFRDRIESEVRRLESTFGLTCELTHAESFPEPGPDQRQHLLRIVREAVTNAARHGGARHVWIDLMARGATWTMSVSNDGRPLAPAPGPRDGLGLRHMRMRARLLGASLSLQPGPRGGAVLEVRHPDSSRQERPTTPPA